MEFNETHWEEIKKIMKKEGTQGVLKLISQSSQGKDRLTYYNFTRAKLEFQEWEGKNVDAVVELINQALIDASKMLEAASDPDEVAYLKQYMNASYYNLAAATADCWPGDPLTREARHFEIGLSAANNSLILRTELKRPPAAFSMAYFIKGVHLFCLGRDEEALACFKNELVFDLKDQALKESPEITAQVHQNILLSNGLIGLTQWKLGQSQGKELYESCLAAFEQKALNSPEKKGDLDFLASELKTLHQKYL